MEQAHISNSTNNTPPSLYKMIIFPWIVCLIAAVFYGYDFFLRIMPSVMIHPLMSTYHVNAATIGLISAFYYYAYTPLQIPSGVVIDRLNTQIVLLVSLLLCIAGTFLFAYVTSLYVVYIARIMMGIGSAFAFVGSLKLAARWLPKKHFAIFSGIATAFGTLGAIGADWILSRMVTHFGWQAAVAIVGYAGILLGVLILLFVKNKPKKIETTHVEKLTWTDSIRLLWQMIRSLKFWINGFIGTALFLPVNVFASLWGVAFLIEGKYFSPTEAASMTSLIFIGMTIGAPISGWFSDFINSRRIPLFISSVAIFVISTLLIYTDVQSHSFIYLLLFLLGFFVGPQVLVFSIAREITPPRTTGISTATTNFAVTLGAAIFQPLIGVLLDLHWTGARSTAGTPIYDIMNYKESLFVIPAIALIAFFAAFLIPKKITR